MNRSTLVNHIFDKGTYLCIGLDPELAKLPAHLLKEADPIFEFNKQIIDATHDICVAYKPNTAFYECHGMKGWQSFEKTKNYIPNDIFTIADAKRGDIGNTSKMYASAFFDTYQFDAITVAPYMGKDSVQPFLDHPDKWTIVLGLTSNAGSQDFQKLKVGERYVYETVIQQCSTWGDEDHLMFVVGATQANDIQHIRSLIPNHFLLVPGVGAQGGDLSAISAQGLNKEAGLLVNSSRGIIYAGNDKDFAKAARKEALLLNETMKRHLDNLSN
jgi:orotidine-5'-phosphate decarboxylase